MAQLDGLRDFTATRQLPSSGLLSGSHLTKLQPSMYTASDSNQPCIEGTLSNSASQNISVLGLSRFPIHSWQGNLNTTRFPSNSLPLNHAFLPDQMTCAGNNLGDCTSLVSAENPGGEMQCEPQLLGDFMQNMNSLDGQKWEQQNSTMMNNPFSNVEYPLPADRMVFRDNNATRSKGLDESSPSLPVASCFST